MAMTRSATSRSAAPRAPQHSTSRSTSARPITKVSSSIGSRRPANRPRELFSTRELSPPFLCQPRGKRRDLRVGGEGIRAGGGRDRQPDRGRIGRGGLMKIGGRGSPFPDAELIRALAAVFNENGPTEIE